MAKLVQTLHSRIQFAIKKGLTGYISPDRIDDEAYAEIMNIWVKHINEYPRNQEISLFYKPFERIEPVTGLTGTTEGTKTVTNCYKYPISILTSSGKKIVERLTISEYDRRFNHPNKGPSTDFPIAKFIGTTIYVAPNVNVDVTYIATPAKLKYAFTVSGDDYIYDDVNSIDIEFDQLWHDQILNRVLSNLGINMREASLIQYSQQEKIAEEK